jgi:hypothetical protein
MVNGTHTGYWLVDLRPSGTECIINSYVTWLNYRLGSSMLETLLTPANKDKENKSPYTLTNQQQLQVQL